VTPGPLSAFPTITAVVPTRDRPALVERAVRSIVGQNYPGRVDCVVVFDGSLGEPPRVDLSSGRSLTAVANRRNPGLAGARNTGVLAAEGDLIAFCDDDDEWLPSKLTRQVDALREHPDCDVVSCANVVIYGDREILRRAPAARITFADLLRSRVAMLHSSTILVRKDAYLDAIGPVDEEIPAGASEDYEWQLRASRHAPIAVVAEPLTRIHWHDGSQYSRRWDLYIGGLAYILDKYPEFETERRGKARIEGQIAFGYAALGRTRESLRWVRRCLRSDWRQPRGYLSLLVGARCLQADTLMHRLHSHGRGI
jgi:glycosyltransferase involved in cell wall biosynthesis